MKLAFFFLMFSLKLYSFYKPDYTAYKYKNEYLEISKINFKNVNRSNKITQINWSFSKTNFEKKELNIGFKTKYFQLLAINEMFELSRVIKNKNNNKLTLRISLSFAP
jgi:hypothetical protein